MTIENQCRTEIRSFSPEQREVLLGKLQAAGYAIDEFGHVKPASLPKEYPFMSVDGNGFMDSARVPLSLGYVGPNFAVLANLDQEGLQQYHAQLYVLYSQS